MGSHIIDSLLFGSSFGTDEMKKIFSEQSLIEKWLDVEVALAKAQAQLNIIPQEAATEIEKKAKIELIDVRELGEDIKFTNHSLVPLLRQLENLCDRDYGQYVHYGATTQDITDTANILQLKEVYTVLERDTLSILRALRNLAEQYCMTVMPGRTHGQHALPITFGYKVAVWLEEMNRNYVRLLEIKDRLLVGQFSGAVGTLASLGDQGERVQQLMMEQLGLHTPAISWHTSRDNLAEFAALLGLISGTVGKIAHEIVLLQKTEVGEVEEPFHFGKVGSSTMPHKRNPSTSQKIVALSRIIRHNIPIFFEGLIHEHERDQIPWQTEWEALPEICILSSAVLSSMITVLEGLTVYEDAMRENLERTHGLILSESVMITLGKHIGKQNGHELVYKACMEAFEQRIPLKDVLLKNELVLQHLSQEDIAEALDTSKYIGLSTVFTKKIISRTDHLLKGAQVNGSAPDVVIEKVKK